MIDRSPGLFLLSCLMLISGRLWLVSDLPLSAQWLPHDDTLFVELARHLIDGKWLGTYHARVLAKPSGYPLFIAGTHVLGVPLLVAQQALYVAAGILLLYAVSPFVRSRVTLLALLGLYLFSPTSYMQDVMAVKRVGLYPTVVTCVLASLAGILASSTNRRARMLWGLGFGLSWAAAMLVRDESTWLIPSAAVVVAGSAWRRFRVRGGRVAAREVVLLVAWMFGPHLIADTLIARSNERAYGFSTTNELTADATRRAYQELLRTVQDGEARDFVPVPQATRARLYREVPAFAELRDSLEAPGNWSVVTCQQIPEACGDLAGAWFWWAVRDAAEKKGYHASARTANDYYLRLADETAAACDEGRLACGPASRTLLLGVGWNHVGEVPLAAAAGLYSLASFESVSLTPQRTEESRQFVRFLLPRYARVTGHDRFSDEAAEARMKTDAAARLRHGLLELYRWMVPSLLFIALVAWTSAVGDALWRGPSDLFLLDTALLGAMVALLVGLAILDRGAFPAFLPRYLAPGVPPMLIFITLSSADGWNRVRTRLYGVAVGEGTR